MAKKTINPTYAGAGKPVTTASASPSGKFESGMALDGGMRDKMSRDTTKSAFDVKQVPGDSGPNPEITPC